MERPICFLSICIDVCPDNPNPTYFEIVCIFHFPPLLTIISRSFDRFLFQWNNFAFPGVLGIIIIIIHVAPFFIVLTVVSECFIHAIPILLQHNTTTLVWSTSHCDKADDWANSPKEAIRFQWPVQRDNLSRETNNRDKDTLRRPVVWEVKDQRNDE